MNPIAELVQKTAQDLLQKRRIPNATYRLQFSDKFTFRDALELVPYLHALGVSDCYASPIFKAREGSTHGYDIVGYGHLNPALGSDEDFAALADALHEHGMGLLIDIVPNHMGIGPDNAWWMDVLENGTGSPYAHYFDINWHPSKPELQNRLLLPILGDQYGTVLESGSFQLSFDEGAFSLHYYETPLPLAPSSYTLILRGCIEALVEELGEDHQDIQELESIVTALSNLPSRTDLDPERLKEGQREKEVIKRRLAALASGNPRISEVIGERLENLNGTPGDPSSFDEMDALLEVQSYRLAFWRVAADEINYRRFFDINTMAAIRLEEPAVFDAVHELVFRLLAENKVSGLRIDHPDGLWNPTRYFQLLQENYLVRLIQSQHENAGDAEELREGVAAWFEAHPNPLLYVVVEKILAPNESLPQDWVVHGTTGYDFLADTNRLFVSGRNEAIMTRIYSWFTKEESNFERVIDGTKRAIMESSLSSEIQALAHRLERLTENTRYYRDFTLNGLRDAIIEFIAALPIYRTYINEAGGVTDHDRRYILAALNSARDRNPRTAQAVFNFLESIFLPREGELDPGFVEFIMKLQQVTGPVMAKSVEDTAFYIYHRLTSLNEVGGEPGEFGLSIREYHETNRARQQDWPFSLLASSTHDTKRSEDVRARINVLSEMPTRWKNALSDWRRMNNPHKLLVNGHLAPDANDEYLLYQTMLGMWPFETPDDLSELQERLIQYMFKAVKEAKRHTSWVNPNEGYDAAIRTFSAALFNPDHPFLASFQELLKPVAYFGQWNSLSQTLLKFTAPGIPDIYQGTEIWDFSLVDPDNRRPVDYEHRRALLNSVQSRSKRVNLMHDFLTNSQDGRIKLYLTACLLNYRRENSEIFCEGTYHPLNSKGTYASSVVAFSRKYQRQQLVIVSPRLFYTLMNGVENLPIGDVWGDTTLTLPATGTYKNILTDETITTRKRSIAVGDLLKSLPVAVFELSG
jgi:(1->4)-alpha-D-glucan 1-alpha-D-glucosylmutase